MTVTHVSCKKETGSVGLDSGNAALQAFEIDTFTLITRTVREDSLVGYTPTSPLTYQLLGATKTSDFGLNKSSFAVSFSLPTSSFKFPDNVVIDSVVFQAVYTGPDQYVGNLTTPMNYTVGEITEQLFQDSTYYTNRKFSTFADENLNNIIHDLKDSIGVVENGVLQMYPPHLRVKMGPKVVNKFINATNADLGSNAAFQSYFHGLLFETVASGLNDGDGNVVYLNFNTGISGLAVYFNDTGKYVFPVAGNGTKLNLYENDFTGATAVLNQLNDTTGNFDETYIQSMCGLKTYVEVPGLLDLLNQGVYGVIDAKFVFNFDKNNTSTEFPSFSRTLLLKRDSTGRNNFVLDLLLNSGFYGGDVTSDASYEFHIYREIQDILNNYRLNGLNLNTGFFLIAPSDKPISGSHMKMDMRKNVDRGVKFVLTVVKTK